MGCIPGKWVFVSRVDGRKEYEKRRVEGKGSEREGK
jgi:hypothetical protein